MLYVIPLIDNALASDFLTICCSILVDKYKPTIAIYVTLCKIVVTISKFVYHILTTSLLRIVLRL